MRNRQEGPDDATDILASLVSRLVYKPGWTFELQEISREQGCQGLTLMIAARVPDAAGGPDIGILHLMPVIPAAYDAETWQRWLLDQILLVERHEACEFFRVDGDQVFFPEHGPGRDPYTVAMVKSSEQAHAAATTFYGRPASGPVFETDG